MNLFLYILGGLLLFCCLITIAILSERKSFNRGKCKCCGEPLRHIDTDSQGGRLYSCKNLHTAVWISYNCVDKHYRND